MASPGVSAACPRTPVTGQLGAAATTPGGSEEDREGFLREELGDLGYQCLRGWLGFPDSSASKVKNRPAMWETWVRSLGWEDPLEKGTATHSSILAWRIPWTV